MNADSAASANATGVSRRSEPRTRAGSRSVLFLSRSLERGGAERQLVGVAKGLSGRGHEVTVALFYGGGALEEELRGTGVEVVHLGKRGRWDVAGFLFRLVREVRRRRSSVLHGVLVLPNLLTVLLKPFLPGTRIVWGVRASNMDLARYDWLARFTFRASCRLARCADLILVNSVAGAEYHARCGYPSVAMAVVPNGIDTARFRPDSQAGCAIRREWGVEHDERLIGLVARLDPMKDHPTFLEALARVCRDRPEVRAVCVGSGPAAYRRELEDKCLALGIQRRLLWVGERADMSAVYSGLDIACLCSIGEGFPNVVAEAMACGTPCVVTDVGDAPDIVGETGRVVEPGDPAALAAALASLLDRVSVELSEVCRERIVGRFGLERLIQVTEALLWPS